MKYQAGSFESGDCIIQISKSEKTVINIDSIVFEQFGEAIYNVILTTLENHNVSNVLVECKDKGALDYTIKSRVETALKRGGFYE